MCVQTSTKVYQLHLYTQTQMFGIRFSPIASQPGSQLWLMMNLFYQSVIWQCEPPLNLIKINRKYVNSLQFSLNATQSVVVWHRSESRVVQRQASALCCKFFASLAILWLINIKLVALLSE